MKCPECNFENGDDYIFCINCGNKLKINDSDSISSSKDLKPSFKENKSMDYQYAEDYDDSDDSINNLDKIFSENNFTIGQINKIKSFIEENDDEDSLENLIQEEISNNEYYKQLLPNEYELLLEFSKKRIWDDLENYGISFIKDNGSKTITKTEMKSIKEEVPVVKQKHGGLTKGAATLGFGLIGLAGTSGVKTEMQTVEKQVPVQFEKTVKDTIDVKLMIKNNRLEIKQDNLKTMINFSEIDEISYENKFIYIKTNREMIVLKQNDDYFRDLITDALSENIYYLKNYKLIKVLYLDDFSNDLNNMWISEILSYNVNNNDNKPSEMDKIELIEKYYSLKESGIITDEEFKKKKQELLK